MKLPRREFLKSSALGISGLLAGYTLKAKAAAPAATVYHDPYETVPLGKTGMKISRVCIGTGMRGGNRESNQTRAGKEHFENLLRGAYERGVRTFDLADLYGTHPYVFPALKGIPRKDYFLVSKV